MSVFKGAFGVALSYSAVTTIYSSVLTNFECLFVQHDIVYMDISIGEKAVGRLVFEVSNVKCIFMSTTYLSA